VKRKLFLVTTALVLPITLAGCDFLTPNWGALHPTATATETATPSATPEQTPTQTSNPNKQPVSVAIVYSSADENGIDVVAQALNVSEDGGTCTLTVSQAGVKKVVSVKAESNVTDTQCFPIHLPRNGFSTGAATFTVSYESTTSLGTSSVTAIDIP
jgi:hypothetical protein